VTHELNLSALYRKDPYFDVMPEWLRRVLHHPGAYGWFIRQNKGQLVSEGALIKLGRDYFVDQDRFPVVAEQIIRSRQGV
jgi:hypothetical protein